MSSLVYVPVFLVVLLSVVVSGWKNDFDQPLDFQCPSDLSFISRFKSTHSSFYEDRRFDFDCKNVPAVSGSVTCNWSGLNFRNCQWTDYVNSWDSNVDYYVPAGSYVIRGVSSYHSNYYEDRRFKFEICQSV
nr:hemagglutinin/amebocyte aggregation factor isoform X2 [Crassostrea gigas]